MQIKTNIPNLTQLLQTCKNIYFIGIGGIGMSALAKYYLSLGYKVAGYDKTLSKITQSLTAFGAQISDLDSPDSIPNGFLNLEETLVVYTPAINKDNAVLHYLQKFGFELFKRSEILGEITKHNFCFAVAGTHGKTTTSTMLGHILYDNNVEATSFLGGISENYSTNLIRGKANVCVVEADEFDRSFLKLSPNIACITSTDADHLDIYGDKKSIESSFKDFSNLVSEELFVKKGLDIAGKTFAINESANYMAYNLRIEKGTQVFDVSTPKDSLEDIYLEMPGAHNVLNALAAIAMANAYGISLPNIAKSLKSFKGVKRRFSYKIKTENLVVIDDYAHHPTEIHAVFETVKSLYSNEDILAVFQPHLYSRTRDFESEFSESLALFDKLLLLPIYPAREKPIQGVTSQHLLEKIRKIRAGKSSNFKLIKECDLTDEILAYKSKVIVFIGAGDIGLMVDKVIEELKNKMVL
jgi:UDP-N-acetylmuramate--alanine ligase